MDERSSSGKGRLVWLQREALGRGKTGIPWAPDLKVAMKDSRFQHHVAALVGKLCSSRYFPSLVPSSTVHHATAEATRNALCVHSGKIMPHALSQSPILARKHASLHDSHRLVAYKTAQSMPPPCDQLEAQPFGPFHASFFLSLFSFLANQCQEVQIEVCTGLSKSSPNQLLLSLQVERDIHHNYTLGAELHSEQNYTLGSRTTL